MQRFGLFADSGERRLLCLFLFAQCLQFVAGFGVILLLLNQNRLLRVGFGFELFGGFVGFLLLPLDVLELVAQCLLRGLVLLCRLVDLAADIGDGAVCLLQLAQKNVELLGIFGICLQPLLLFRLGLQELSAPLGDSFKIYFVERGDFFFKLLRFRLLLLSLFFQGEEPRVRLLICMQLLSHLLFFLEQTVNLSPVRLHFL